MLLRKITLYFLKKFLNVSLIIDTMIEYDLCSVSSKTGSNQNHRNLLLVECSGTGGI